MQDGFININGDSVQTLEVLFLTTMLVMMTSFTRYIVSLSFLRTAMGTQQTPPNMVLVGLALFLTLLTMGPVLEQIQQEAYEPYAAEQISGEEFFERAGVPLKEFMLRNTETGTLELFCDLARVDPVTKSVSDRLSAVYSLYADRYCGVFHLDVHGHDYAAAFDDFHAFQDPALYFHQRLGAFVFHLGARRLLTAGGRR